MRKFWIMLLATGLIMAFSVPAFAVGGTNVNFSGTYLVRGLYASNPTLKDEDHGNTGAYHVWDQRLRMQADFKVAEGLVLVTRFDALEKRWGDTSWYGTYDSNTRQQDVGAAGKAYTQENFEFERVYVDFTTGIGRFMVGYQNFTAWGTAIADGNNTKPGIKYLISSGPLTFVAAYEFQKEGQILNNTRNFNDQDADSDTYDLGVMYKWTGGEAGLLFQYGNGRDTRPAGNYKTQLYLLDPYVKATFGPVYFEAEGIYLWGKAADFDTATHDQDLKEMGVYLKVNVDLKPAYVGAIFAWVSGDDDPTDNDVESGWLKQLNAGSVFEPCLIFGSYWYNHAVGVTAGGYAATGTTNAYTYFFDNIWFGQVYGGIKPVPKLDLFASVSYMKADKKPTSKYVSKDIGWEIDVKASYKIFDNLEYMIGAAYFVADDYFKGENKANKIDDNYLLLHQLTLSF